MTMVLTQFPEEYDLDIQTRIFDGLGTTPQMWRDYFNVSETSKYTENTTGYSGFGQMGNWQDGQDLPIDEAVSIFDSTLTQAFYGMGFKVSRKHVKYGQLRLIQRWADALARSLAQKYGAMHAAVLGNGFTTTYASLGSVALYSASHTSAGGVSRSNLNASAALTPANLEVLIVQGLNTLNYRGLNDPVYYTKLVIPPALRRTAMKILQSDGESGTANNDINTQKGMMSIVVEPFLTGYSTTAYHLQAPTHGLISLHGQPPQPVKYVEPSSESLVHGLSADFVCGVEFWEGMAGSQGA